MVLKKIIFSILLLFSFSTISSTGEKDFGQYYGPLDPSLKFNEYNNALIFQDSQFKKNYIDEKIESKLTHLNDFFKNEFYQGLTCPNHFYLKEKGYIEYLNRLLALSYYFEAFQDYEFNAKRFEAKKNHHCLVDWKKAIRQCRPKSRFMKNFLKNSEISFLHLKKVKVSTQDSLKDVRNNWLRATLKPSRSITQSRIKLYCFEKSCTTMNTRRALKMMNNICIQDIKEFISICSEEDQLFGQSSIRELQFLLGSSEALRGTGNTELARGCLRRYVHDNKRKERKSKVLKVITPLIYEQQISSESAYTQGRLFSIGALREFSQKGLYDLFARKKKRRPQKIIAKNEENKMKPSFEKITLPKIERKKRIEKKVRKNIAKAKKKTVRKSSFLTASLFRERLSLDELNLDMNKFQYDYIFTFGLIQKMQPVIDKFSTFKSLRDMKKYDKLGSQKSPIPLKFLKFLMDKNMHKEIYNLINVIGNRFFVKNDIDKNIKKLEFVQITNSESTNNLWLITILKAANKN